MEKLDDPRIIDLPKISDPRGNLSFIEGIHHVPFKLSRVYWIYDVPGGKIRHGHAFKSQDEFIVALSGSFDVVITKEDRVHRFHMSRSYFGIYIPHGTWRELDNFSTNSVALVLSSGPYDANDYIEDFDEFLQYKKQR